MPPVIFPERIPAHLYIAPVEKPKEKSDFDRQKSQRGNFNVLQQFYRGLPKVQRALANVPTYMILDDHDVTDDYFLNPVWRTRVLEKKLGQAIIGNAMIAYSVFQDWGNDPVAYRTGPKAQLLSLIQKLFPATITKGPDQPTFQQIAQSPRARQTARADRGQQVRVGQSAIEMALHGRRSEAPCDCLRQSNSAQLRHPGRSAGERVGRRDGGSDPIASASGRSGNPDRHRASSGDRAAGAGRDCRATVVSRVRRCPGDEKAQPALDPTARRVCAR